MLNNNENQFIEKINEAKRYVKGELELDCVDGEWYALDYRADSKSALPIDDIQYRHPLITNEEAEAFGINIIKCCDTCGIYYVG